MGVRDACAACLPARILCAKDLFALFTEYSQTMQRKFAELGIECMLPPVIRSHRFCNEDLAHGQVAVVQKALEAQKAPIVKKVKKEKKVVVGEEEAPTSIIEKAKKRKKVAVVVGEEEAPTSITKQVKKEKKFAVGEEEAPTLLMKKSKKRKKEKKFAVGEEEAPTSITKK